MLPELGEAVRVDVLDSVRQSASLIMLSQSSQVRQISALSKAMDNVHAGGASRDSPALLQTVQLAPAVGLGLALHVVIVVVAASRADEEGSREQRRRAGADLLDLGDRVGERRRIDQSLLVKSGALVSVDRPGAMRSPEAENSANWATANESAT